MSRHSQACLVIFALCATYASSRDLSFTPVTIYLFNDDGVSGPVLKSAELEAQRIFEAAHIGILWRECTPAQDKAEVDPACHALRTPNHLNLRIVRGSARENDDVFGVAFLGADGAGAYSDVFYGSVEKLQDAGHGNVGRILGHVMAHEIGHLLIGSHAHSPWGIMAAKWHGEDLRRLEMGRLLFTAEQEKSIYRRLHAGSPEVTASETLTPVADRVQPAFFAKKMSRQRRLFGFPALLEGASIRFDRLIDKVISSTRFAICWPSVQSQLRWPRQ
jgi:hypothetical protein